MPLLKRFLWLLAWSLWLWLGFGLYRELPREPGPMIAEIPVKPSDEAEFIGNAHLVATFSYVGNPYVVRVFNADTGDFVREISFEGHWPKLGLQSWRTHGVIIAEGQQKKTRGLHVVDLRTGSWKRLSDKMSIGVAVHPTKPWIVFRESAPPIDEPRRTTVIDWETGAEVFVRPRDGEHVHVGMPIFLGEADRLVIPVTRESPGPQSDPPPDLEVWRLGAPNRLEKVVRSPTPRWYPSSVSASANRIAIRTLGPDTNYLDVFDIDAERLIFSVPPHAERVSEFKRSNDEGFHFSKSGRTILGGVPVGVWNVDSGAKLWSRSNQIPRVLEDEDAFLLAERWGFGGTWMPRFFWRWLHGGNTLAVYNLETAALRFRCWDQNFSLHTRSADGTLGLSGGVVYRLPYQVNVGLLALCQTILALPLMLLWVILRWRRKRRLRLASMTP